MKLLLKYTFKFKGMFGLCTLTNMLKAIVSIAMAVILGNIIDVFTSGEYDVLKDSMTLCVGLIIAIIVIYFLDTYFMSTYTKKTMSFIREDIFSSIMNKDHTNFFKVHTGQYMSILNNDLAIVKTEFLDSSFNLLFQLLCFFLTISVIGSINPMIVVLLLALAVFSLAITSIVAGRAAGKKEKYSKNLENLTRIGQEFLSGYYIIKNFNILDKIKRQFRTQNRNVESSRKECNMMIGLIDILSVVTSTLIFVVIIVLCVHLIVENEITVGMALIVIQLTSNVTDPISQILFLINQMKSVSRIGEKITKIVNGHVVNGGGVEKREFKSDIKVRDLSFSYNPEKAGSKLIKNIDLNIKKGGKYAIVGKSGSGKSTLLKLLMRYYSEYDGKILVDGVDIRDIASESFYDMFSMIEQNVFMFNDTLKENLCLYNHFDDELIADVIDKTKLRQLVDSLPEGLYTEIGEDGNTISGGERQRIALGRALLKNAQVLILDEFTANLDNKASNDIERIMLELDDVTVMTITHKLSPNILEQYDEIFVMNKGQIVERGTFVELLDKRQMFYSMYYIQSEDTGKQLGGMPLKETVAVV